ncbi:Modification methylase BspRI [compost metagenome]|jgi:DNA (cytosine-5)-methyltransferase 1
MHPEMTVKNPDASTVNNASALPKKNIHQATTLPEIISLFCGAGGLDWGFHQEGFHIPIAIDISSAAINTHKRNFPETHSVAADLIKLQPEGVFELVSSRVKTKSRIGLIGGPPCQGFSRANTKAKADDPRNQLPQLYLDVVKRLQKDYIVEFVVLENVLGIRDKKHAPTYEALINGLGSLGFSITEKELCALDFGVPQNRRRVVLSALRSGQGYSEVRPQTNTGLKTVEEAIGSLAEPAFFSRNLNPESIPVHPNHWTMNPKSPRFSDPDGDYPKGRSFKRLTWSDASPTIAFGHREIHIHPNGTRRLSIYEAMRLQSFPSSFVLEGNLSEQVEQVSNAVPPLLGKSIAAAVKKSMNF